MTTNHPANGPVSLDRLHQISEILSKAATQSDGGNLGCAMSDAVKVIDGAIASRNVETIYQVMYGECWRDITEEQYHDHAIHESPIRIVYTAPPAPEPMKDHQIRELVNDLRDIAIEYHGTQQLRERIARTVRAAMLQVENHTEQHLDMVVHSGDDNENGKDVTLINEGNMPAMQIKPVADLYSITSPTGSETTFTFDASEASSFVGSGWSVQEYVELERYQEAITGK